MQAEIGASHRLGRQAGRAEAPQQGASSTQTLRKLFDIMLLDSSVPFDTFDIIFMDLSVPFENDTLTYTEDQTLVFWTPCEKLYKIVLSELIIPYLRGRRARCRLLLWHRASHLSQGQATGHRGKPPVASPEATVV